jgi:hypothetical protein
MFEVDINFLAVLAAAVVSIVIGSLWYSPLLFGKKWIELSGICKGQVDEAKKAGMGKYYAMAFVNSFIIATLLAYFIELTAVADLVEAAIMGAAAALGFSATTLLSSVIWEKKPFALYLINTGHYLVSYVLMSVIVTLITYR